MNKIILRILSFVLLSIIVFSTFSFFVYADAMIDETQETAEEYIDEAVDASDNIDPKLEFENILSFSCHYDPKTKTVKLKGTMDYDAFAIYGNSALLIYAIPYGKTENDVINDKSSKPIAESPVSITFSFAFEIESIAERHSRYAIFLRSSEGEYILTSEAQYAEVDGEISVIDNKNSFKGLSGNYTSNISDVNSQMTVIPVYLDSVLTDDSNGYVYQADDVQFLFNKNYVDELDSQIRSLSLFGTDVYLQFLLRSGGLISTTMSADAEYALPNVFEDKTVLAIHAVTDFLTSRYFDGDCGNISGIVLGKAWDNPLKYNSYDGLSFEQYALLCGHYTAIVSNASRDINSKLNIILPFDGNGFFVEQKDRATANDRLSAKALLSALMLYFDQSSYSGLKCSFLIEAEETPLDILSTDLSDGIDINKKLSEDKFYIGEHGKVSEFLEELSTKYKSANKNYTITWTPKTELRGNALCAAYAYAFYELFTDSNVVGFNVEFSQNAENRENLNDLLFILKNIDSNNSSEATKNILEFFGKKTWSEVLGGKELSVSSSNLNYASDPLTEIPDNIKGEFCYFDFSKSFLPDDWLVGVGCSDLKIEHLSTGEKVLKSNFFTGNKDFCDLIYVYEHPENISYTPYIKFNLEITSEQLSPLYEIKFLFSGENMSFESNSLIKGNELQEIILDMTNAKDFSLLKSVKISVRCLDETVDSCSLSIHNITGYSLEYDDDQLKELIEKERDKQNEDSDSEISWWLRFAIVAIVISASALIGFIFILILKKNSRVRRKE